MVDRRAGADDTRQAMRAGAHEIIRQHMAEGGAHAVEDPGVSEGDQNQRVATGGSPGQVAEERLAVGHPAESVEHARLGDAVALPGETADRGGKRRAVYRRLQDGPDRAGASAGGCVVRHVSRHPSRLPRGSAGRAWPEAARHDGRFGRDVIGSSRERSRSAASGTRHGSLADM